MMRGLLLLSMAMACVGCGQSGDLFLPTPGEPAAEAATGADTQAEPADESKNSEDKQERTDDDEETPAG